ncbi:MAG: hypothetical protein IKZ47_00060, partial [Clostridia bacterium]|nr:hypothetical protein [Clostridia bacterium]
MKTGRALALFICAVMAFCLCGCDTFTVDTEKLISPPELTGSMYPIGKALSESVRGEYQLKYPQFGEYRSAIILKDIDGDKTPEAFAFYSTAGDEMTNMHINAIRQNGDEYKSVSEQTVVAGGVERVEFCDLDGDGISEIIVGWEVYGVSEKQLCVYSLNRDNMAVMLSEKYTGFLNCDLTGNGREELFVNVLDTANFSNTAELYGFSGGAAQKLGSCALDPAVKTALTPTLSKLTTGQDAVFIDEIKGAGAVTEVVYFAGGELKNPLYEEENNEGSRTLRAAAILSSDIDSDLALEIPVAKELPNAAGTDEQLFYTDWCGFDGVNLIVKRITIVNSIDGYYLEIPQNLVGKIAVLKDIDNHRRVIYGYDAETGEISERLATVAVIYAGDWDSDD